MKCLVILIPILFTACQQNQKIERENQRIDIECSRIKQKMQYGEEEDKVTLELDFVGYACGDCIPNYRVLKVVFSESDNYNYYFNKEIHLDIVNKDLKIYIENKIEELSLSDEKYKYIVTGKFKRNGFGIGKLEVFEGEIVKL